MTEQKNSNLNGSDFQKILADIVDVLHSKKAQDIKVLDLRKKSAFASYIIIATGTSTRQVFSLYQYVEKYFKEKSIYPHIEGTEASEWILLFAEDIVIHLFTPDMREFYQLDKIWHTGDNRLEFPITSPK
ncbi:MAG TPA: ribosome silencing factor [Holosporales bacterium]|nr:ribosome silencing factor [Holosporales bacterium]